MQMLSKIKESWEGQIKFQQQTWVDIMISLIGKSTIEKALR